MTEYEFRVANRPVTSRDAFGYAEAVKVGDLGLEKPFVWRGELEIMAADSGRGLRGALNDAAFGDAGGPTPKPIAPVTLGDMLPRFSVNVGEVCSRGREVLNCVLAGVLIDCRS